MKFLIVKFIDESVFRWIWRIELEKFRKVNDFTTKNVIIPIDKSGFKTLKKFPLNVTSGRSFNGRVNDSFSARRRVEEELVRLKAVEEGVSDETELKWIVQLFRQKMRRRPTSKRRPDHPVRHRLLA